MEDVTLEHIMPRTYVDGWSKNVNKTQHSKIKDLWANLVPLSKPMNSHVGQDTYEKKRKHFEDASMFISARNLGAEHTDWGEDQIKARSEKLADWATTRWAKD